MNLPDGITKDKLQKVVLVGVLSLAAIALVGHLCAWKQITARSAAKRQIAELDGKIKELQTRTLEAKQSKSTREQMRFIVDAQRATMVSGDPFSWVVREMSLLSEHHPVQILSMRPGALGPHSQYSRYSVFTTRLELAAGYDQIGEFIRDIENKFPTAQIQSLELGAGQSDRDHRVTLELAFLVQPDSPTDKLRVTPPLATKTAS